MYDPQGPVLMARALENGKNFATFDLNINIREMRDAQIKGFQKIPEVVILGASHWQEAHPELVNGVDLYNAHVHRDYYEDMLAVVEMFVRHNKLPKTIIMAIRDRLFTPVAKRTDFLWLPGIPYYRAMARRLDMQPHAVWETLPTQRWKEQLSVSMLYTNVSRWYKAAVLPHATGIDHHKTLDTLRPGGSIYWSQQHQDFFTRERAERLAKAFAEANRDSPPAIDPVGLKTLDRLLRFLKEQGVDVYFVHPPFNPTYYDAIRNSPYEKGLERIKQITGDFAKKYGFKRFGSFSPHPIGCTSDMYIDAEHANPVCLGKLLAQFKAMFRPEPAPELERKPEPEFKPGPTAALSSAVAAKHELALPTGIVSAGRKSQPIEPPPIRASAGLAAASSGPEVVIIARATAGAPSISPEPVVGLAGHDLPPLPMRKPKFYPPLPHRNPVMARVKCDGEPERRDVLDNKTRSPRDYPCLVRNSSLAEPSHTRKGL
ncbi:MAG: hypothetical protein AAF732_19210 [Pseudomonadota bacterium]